MIGLRHFLFLVGLALAVCSILAGVGFVVLPKQYEGEDLLDGHVRYVVEGADLWRFTRTLETRILVTDTRGITQLIDAPSVGVILRDPETGHKVEQELGVTPELVHEDTLVWVVSLTVPRGRDYCGVYLLEGTYQDMSGRVHDIDWSPEGSAVEPESEAEDDSDEMSKP